MTYEIKDTGDLITAMFEAFGTDAEADTMQALEDADSANDSIFWEMIEKLHNGIIDGIKTINNGITYTYTRSVQTAGAIQRTAWLVKGDDIIPLGHTDIYNKETRANITDLYYPGLYETVTY
jgi:hypothetical protein